VTYPVQVARTAARQLTEQLPEAIATVTVLDAVLPAPVGSGRGDRPRHGSGPEDPLRNLLRFSFPPFPATTDQAGSGGNRSRHLS
jgi:hypothetical protein